MLLNAPASRRAAIATLYWSVRPKASTATRLLALLIAKGICERARGLADEVHLELSCTSTLSQPLSVLVIPTQWEVCADETARATSQVWRCRRLHLTTNSDLTLSSRGKNA